MTEGLSEDSIQLLASSVLDSADRVVSEAMRARTAALLAALGSPLPSASTAATPVLLGEFALLLAKPEASTMWLTISVLSARLPHQPDVEDALRTARLDGPLIVVAEVLKATVASQDDEPYPAVEVIRNQVVVDLHHTAQANFATGIQRVARETASRWQRNHDIVALGWTRNYQSLRRLSVAESERAMRGTAHPRSDDAPAAVVVPWQCTYLVPELLAEPDRTRAFQAIVRHSGSQVGMIGFDCVPLTTAETTADGMGGAFAMMLSAATYADRIAAISHGAALEYRGWAQMLAGTGLSGPDVEAVLLPVQARELDADALLHASHQFVVPGLPMVLVVGSHEPRKNHLAVLHAAELLWRDGYQFSLAFVGGNAWNSTRFTNRLRELQHEGRPVHSMSAIDDDVLWGAYRAARCTVFPSLNEGFGLPVAESLACGTPVITSGFGSMREIAGDGGAILIDPRNDADLIAALRSLLTDDELHDRLAAEARALPVRSWDAYAEETWTYLTQR